MRRAKDVLHGEALLLVKLPNGVGQHLHRPDTKIVRGHWGKLKRPSAAGAGGILGKQVMSSTNNALAHTSAQAAWWTKQQGCLEELLRQDNLQITPNQGQWPKRYTTRD